MSDNKPAFDDKQMERVKSMGEILFDLVRVAKKKDVLPELLLAMARVLQSELSSLTGKGVIEHRASLEMIMRAVMAAIENRPESGKYIEEKIRLGTTRLLDSIETGTQGQKIAA